jgi:hypothetical protein
MLHDSETISILLITQQFLRMLLLCLFPVVLLKVVYFPLLSVDEPYENTHEYQGDEDDQP